jgi:hypothetical protein
MDAVASNSDDISELRLQSLKYEASKEYSPQLLPKYVLTSTHKAWWVTKNSVASNDIMGGSLYQVLPHCNSISVAKLSGSPKPDLQNHRQYLSTSLSKTLIEATSWRAKVNAERANK